MEATIFIDVQKDFIDKALKNEQAIAVMPKLIEFAKARKDVGDKLYATRDTHTKEYLSTLEGKKLPVEHCIEGEDGWMLDDRLMEVLDGCCTFINKPTFGSYDLVEVIKEDIAAGNKIDKINICGFCTDICVVSNALLLRAAFPNMEITVMQDYCAGVTPETHTAALKTMQMCQIDIA